MQAKAGGQAWAKFAIFGIDDVRTNIGYTFDNFVAHMDV